MLSGPCSMHVVLLTCELVRAHLRAARHRLTAQLARTEEAAKRAMVQQDSSLRGPGAQRLLDAQRQLEDLAGAQGESAARLATERRRSADLRAKVEELKQRLHAALREQRRLVQQVCAISFHCQWIASFSVVVMHHPRGSCHEYYWGLVTIATCISPAKQKQC